VRANGDELNKVRAQIAFGFITLWHLAGYPDAETPRIRSLRIRHNCRHLICTAFDEERPDRSRHLVGQCNGGYLVRTARP
jgi:hypothetical protein